MTIHIPKFGLNRHDTSSVSGYAKDISRSEDSGWEAAFLPDSQLRRRDTYVLLAAAAIATEKIVLGPLLVNPITRHPSVTASSIATISELAPGRTVLGCGIGDTAVRLAGLKPATVRELELSIHLMKSLLSGKSVEVGSARPARLPFPQDVPVWIAAGGPRTLEMAGSCADGVFIRVGTNVENIRISVEKIRKGARNAGRDPLSVKIGAVFHTVFVEDLEQALLMGKSMAAGYYEYSPMLMDNLEMEWEGAHPDSIKESAGIWPDFHHSTDLLSSGTAVDFLTEDQARSFCFMGNSQMITSQVVSLIKNSTSLGIDFEYVVLHPIPNPPAPDPGSRSYLERVPAEIISEVKSILE